jgi:hypothetical protein
MNHLQQIAQSYEDYTTAYNAQQISATEYKSLLEGLEVEKAVSMNAEELQYKENLNIAINAAISVVSALA